MNLKKLIFSLSLLCIINTNVFAGQSCEGHTQKSEVLNSAINKAVLIKNTLNNTDNKVVLIARVGQDLSKYGLKYSHMAFAYKKDGQDDWQVMHELNTCGTDKSQLYIQGLGNFLLDDMISYDNKIFVPNKDLQQKLYDLLVNNIQEMKNFHESHYNMVSYPFSVKYQNSNQYILEVLAQVLSNNKIITTRQEAQQWLKLMGYQPTTLKIDTLTRLGGRIFKANIAFDDQPFNRRMQGNIDTITVDSIYDFLSKIDKQGSFIELND